MQQLDDLGHLLAKLTQSLSKCEVSPFRNTHQWDLTAAAQQRDQVLLVPVPVRHRILVGIFYMCYAWTATRLENLRHTSFNGDGVGRGMLLSTGGLLHNVIKIKPPMSLNADEVYMVVRAFDDELSAMEG